jgi:hypothetical protein
MNTLGSALLLLLLGAFVWVGTVDTARALRSGVAKFRIGKWSGAWENPVCRLSSPLAFWSAVIWNALWVVAFAIILAVVAASGVHSIK